MLHALIGTVRCLFGHHTGPWQYEVSSVCTQTCGCTRFGPRRRRVAHQFDDEFVQKDPCTLVRPCARCSGIDIAEVHDWEYDEGEEEGGRGRCSRCGVEDDRWVVFTWPSPRSGEAERILWRVAKADREIICRERENRAEIGLEIRVEHNGLVYLTELHRERVAFSRRVTELRAMLEAEDWTRTP